MARRLADEHHARMRTARVEIGRHVVAPMARRVAPRHAVALVVVAPRIEHAWAVRRASPQDGEELFDRVARACRHSALDYRMRRIACSLALCAALAAYAAEPYPSRPVKLIVAFTAGGTTDIMARMLAPRLTERFKQPFVIENRPGAGGNLGTEVACRAAPDGYTLIVNTVGPMAVNPTLYKNLACNPLTELVPIAQISDVPNVLVVHPSLKVTTMEGFIAYAKAHSGQLNYGSTGIGTSSHLSSFVIASRAGFEATHIP